MDNRVAYLISKKLTGEISEPEAVELNSCLMADPELHEFIALIDDAWTSRPGHETDKVAVDGLVVKLQKSGHHLSETALGPAPVVQFEKHKKATRWRRIIWAAATIVIITGTWLIFDLSASTNIPEEKEMVNQVATKSGSRSHMVLRDGTKVWLNSDSKLTYANNFDGETREIHLSGEAYFEVVSNPKRPFIIHSNKMTVKVTGTTFNVRDYPEESRAETSLITGKVEVRPLHDPLQVYYLKPKEKIILRNFENEIEKKEAPDLKKVMAVEPVEFQTEIVRLKFDPIDNFSVETAWVNDQLAFVDESFRDVAEKMGKWYNIDIVFKSAGLESLRFTGRFENESVQEALQALQFTTPFTYEIKDQIIFISKK